MFKTSIIIIIIIVVVIVVVVVVVVIVVGSLMFNAIKIHNCYVVIVHASTWYQLTGSSSNYSLYTNVP